MILKAGTILINEDKIGLVYRDNYNDYSFPKGHVEKGESFLECAIRETNEETKREVNILMDKEIYIEEYKNSKGEDCKCYYYLASDAGKSDNDSWEVHDLVWVDFDKVESTLTHNSSKEMWNSIKGIVKEYLK